MLLSSSHVVYNIYINIATNKYKSLLINDIHKFLNQQRRLLEQLSQNIIGPIKDQDTFTVAINLRAYEDMLFALSRLNLSLPARIYFVSLSVPQNIIGSNGKVSNKILAPDEKYYINIIDNPTQLTISNAYEELSMPNLFFCNLGLGVIDHGDKFYGQLDMQISINALQHHIATHATKKSWLFNFTLNKDNITLPEITLKNRHLYLIFILVLSAAILAIIAISKLMVLYYLQYKHQKYALIDLHIKYDLLMSELKLIKSLRQVQHKYGVLSASGANNDSLIDIQQILQDAHVVNSEDALLNGVTIQLPLFNTTSQLRFYGNRLRLMQILSGIMHETINVLPSNSTIMLQIEIVPIQDNLHQIHFIFNDNGFYNQLENRHAIPSNADIRMHGWDNIKCLIELELGELRHVHTAYSGNIISFTIMRKIEQKVVNIENYVC